MLFFFLYLLETNELLSHGLDLIVESRPDHDLLLLVHIHPGYPPVMFSLFLVFVIRVIDCKLNRALLLVNRIILINLLLLATPCQRNWLFFLHLLLLPSPRQYLDREVDRVALAPLIPRIVLHEHLQHVPDLDYLAEETGAERLEDWEVVEVYGLDELWD